MKKRNVYEVEDKLCKVWKALLIMGGVLTLLIAIAQLLEITILVYTGLIAATLMLIVAVITFPIASWVEKEKQKLKDTESCFETYNRFE